MRPGGRELRRGLIVVLLFACSSPRPAPVATGGPWDCPTSLCVQRYPLLPDDGEWECADLEGVAVCRSIAEAAGVVAGRPAEGWTCGAGAGPEAEGRRICVDASPETPGAGGWRCHFAHNPEQRVCKRDPNAVAAVPPKNLRPSCWLDVDCGDGHRCHFGACE